MSTPIETIIKSIEIKMHSPDSLKDNKKVIESEFNKLNLNEDDIRDKLQEALEHQSREQLLNRAGKRWKTLLDRLTNDEIIISIFNTRTGQELLTEEKNEILKKEVPHIMDLLESKTNLRYRLQLGDIYVHNIVLDINDPASRGRIIWLLISIKTHKKEITEDFYKKIQDAAKKLIQESFNMINNPNLDKLLLMAKLELVKQGLTVRDKSSLNKEDTIRDAVDRAIEIGF
jgi:flagellar basal body-associated protein FliL